MYDVQVKFVVPPSLFAYLQLEIDGLFIVVVLH